MDGNFETPTSNRGVLRTDRSALRACVDWVQATFTAVYEKQQIFDILGMENSQFIEQEKSLYLYRKQFKCGNIRVLTDGYDPGMGIHVQMSGQGCREYETFHADGWDKFFQRVLAAGGEFSRLDVAIDDIAVDDQKPYFKIKTIRRKVKEGCTVTRFRKGKYIEGFECDTGRSLGETIYFGSGKSEVQIRMYEKDFEREAAGKQIEENIAAWNRVEVQSRNDRAQALALYLAINQDILPIVQGVLRQDLSFRVKDENDSNKRRWPECDWWVDFLDDAEKLRLSSVAPDRTIEKAKTWITKQVEPTMAMLFLAMGSDFEQFIDHINSGLERLTDEQLKMAEDYFAKIIEERKEWEYLRKIKYQEMMFRHTRDKPKHERMIEKWERED